jgi:cytochrome c oxidase subunit III
MTAFGSRDPLWWGVALLIAIESMVFLLLIFSYVYLRDDTRPWPPSAIPHVVQQLALVDLVLLIATCWPMHVAEKATTQSRLARMRRGLVGATVLVIAALALRGLVVSLLPFRWDTHAYGSLFWMFLFLHSLHVATSAVENMLLLYVISRAPVEEKHLVDVKVNGLYWYFVVVAWVPVYITVFLDPASRRL